MPLKIETIYLDNRLLTEEYAIQYATAGSAAMDLRASALITSQGRETLAVDQSITLAPFEQITLGTGICVDIDNVDAALSLLPRSGLGSKQGIILGNSVGLIDSDYQGEIMITLWNRSDKDFTFSGLDRLCQAMFVPVIRAELVPVDQFSRVTERGAGGYGHTGTK